LPGKEVKVCGFKALRQSDIIRLNENLETLRRKIEDEEIIGNCCGYGAVGR
jgi:hypothetical protein